MADGRWLRHNGDVTAAHDTSAVGQLLLFADLIADGIGGFRLKPRPPQREVSTAEAARMLGVAERTLLDLRNTALGERTLRWRPKSDRPGSWLLWETDSLRAYIAATRNVD